LELFYDLVYVVLIAELAHALAGHIDLSGLATYAFLFVIVWWAWLNGTMYHDLHGKDDIRTRFFTFLQMFIVASMAVFAHDAMGESALGFALSYAAFQLVLAYLGWRTWVHDPDHRPRSQPYSLSFLVTALLFIISVFLPEPWRYYLWMVALAISMLLPVMTFALGWRDPQVRAEIDRTTAVSPSAVERFGLFTIIVLGEVIAAVVRGVAGLHDLTWLVGVTAALGMLIAIWLWWVYFDSISHHLPRSGNVTVSAWLYLHLPMTMGIAAVGAAVLNVVDQTGGPLTSEVRWLLVGAVAVALISIGLLTRTIETAREQERIHRVAGRVVFLSSFVVLLLGFTSLSTVPLLVLVNLLMLAPVFVGFKVWVDQLDAEEAATA
jgi:low temperature requirement protein LtrA